MTDKGDYKKDLENIENELKTILGQYSEELSEKEKNKINGLVEYIKLNRSGDLDTLSKELIDGAVESFNRRIVEVRECIEKKYGPKTIEDGQERD